MAKRKRAFRVKDIFLHKALSSLSVTPDGSVAAFLATQPDLPGNKNVSEIWAWSQQRGAWQVTFDGRATQPEFSPRGDRLGFLSDRGGEKLQLHVMGGPFCEGRKVTDFEHGVVKFAWSPNGRQIAIIAQPDRTPEEKKNDEDKRDWSAKTD